ncbi:hypothetical protein HZ326_20263 [Fusarium oxysporum f. sp. albedinis]|nr:hypothetical protein HZ326_20263 [Fusarium oxysporum f. sp. albedinis]
MCLDRPVISAGSHRLTLETGQDRTAQAGSLHFSSSPPKKHSLALSPFRIASPSSSPPARPPYPSTSAPSRPCLPASCFLLWLVLLFFLTPSSGSHNQRPAHFHPPSWSPKPKSRPNQKRQLVNSCFFTHSHFDTQFRVSSLDSNFHPTPLTSLRPHKLAFTRSFIIESSLSPWVVT